MTYQTILSYSLVLIIFFSSCTKNNFEYQLSSDEVKVGLNEEIAQKYSIMALKDRQLYNDNIIQLNDENKPQKKLFLNSTGNGYTMWKNNEKTQRTWNYIIRLKIENQKIYADISFGH